MRLAVYGLGRFFVGGFYEAEALARSLLEPVPVVFTPCSAWISSSFLWASATASAVNPSTGGKKPRMIPLQKYST